MKTITILVALVMPFLSAQCTSMSTSNPDGTTQKVTAFGGSGAYRNGKTRLAWDNRKSFRDFMLGLVGLGTAGANAYVEGVKAATDQAFIASQTAQHAATQGTIQNAQNVGERIVTQGNSANVGAELAPAVLKTPSAF